MPLSRPLPALLRYEVTPIRRPPVELRLDLLPSSEEQEEPAAALAPRRDPRLLKIGGLLLGIGYAPAVALALALSSQAGQPGGPGLASNYTLLVPALGPLVSGVLAPATSPPGTAGAVLTGWTLPIVLTLGLVQGTGTALLLAGAMPKIRASKSGSDPLDLNFPPWRTH